MTVSRPFYVIQRGNCCGTAYFDAKHGIWEGSVVYAQRYATQERAIVDAEEWAMGGCGEAVCAYRLNIGHNGQTVILPA